VDTGLIAQNVYLAASALGLACWFHNCDKQALAKLLGLGPQERVLFGQTIGYAEDMT
jgi:nitroreductase